MGRFVPLECTTFFFGRNSTPEEEVEEEEEEEEEELLTSSKDAELWLPPDKSSFALDVDAAELASSCGFHSQSEWSREASETDARSLRTACATFKVILDFINMANFLARPFFCLIILAKFNPFRQINRVWCHSGMATCQVRFDVQNPRGGTAPSNRTFTRHVFLFAHGHCLLQYDYTQTRASDFLAHNTRCACACAATTKTARFGLTTHFKVRYHLSLPRVHCHIIGHRCQRKGQSTKEKKFCCFCRPHTSMCHTSVRLCT